MKQKIHNKFSIYYRTSFELVAKNSHYFGENIFCGQSMC